MRWVIVTRPLMVMQRSVITQTQRTGGNKMDDQYYDYGAGQYYGDYMALQQDNDNAQAGNGN
jgi:hypothetical protein